ncbi:MAG: WG repeat-containing protein [Oscillospiraceae bacterium]|nr:WG repeat-containing protein [Oscillospiraceae bacterium]
MKILLASLLVLLLLAGCGSAAVVNDNEDYTTEATTEYIATTAPVPPPVTINGVVWRIAPTLDLGHVHNCCGVFVDSRNRGIDSITGEVGEWGCGDHCVSANFRWIDLEQRVLGYGKESHSLDGIDWINLDDGTSSWLAEIDGLFLVRRADFTMLTENFRDEEGNIGLPSEAFGELLAVVRIAEHEVTILTDFVYDDVPWGNNLGIIAVRQGERWGTVDHNGDLIIPLMFENIVLIDEETAFVRYNGRYGILDIHATAANF